MPWVSSPAAGVPLLGSDLATLMTDVRHGVVARARRTTNSSGSTTTEVGVLRIDGFVTAANRAYTVRTASSMIFSSTVANDIMEARLRYSMSGAATIASTQIGVRAETARTAAASEATDGVMSELFVPGAGTLSVLLSIARTSGTGSCSLNAAATYPIALYIVDEGYDPGDTGISL